MLTFILSYFWLLLDVARVALETLGMLGNAVWGTVTVLRVVRRRRRGLRPDCGVAR